MLSPPLVIQAWCYFMYLCMHWVSRCPVACLPRLGPQSAPSDWLCSYYFSDLVLSLVGAGLRGNGSCGPDPGGRHDGRQRPRRLGHALRRSPGLRWGRARARHRSIWKTKLCQCGTTKNLSNKRIFATQLSTCFTSQEGMLMLEN